MPFAAFSELANEMFRLYKLGEYQRALAVINRDFEHFPDQMGRMYFWRVCLHSVLGQQEEALYQLQQALDLGFGYAEEQLRYDSDLKSLQGVPEFERLVARSKEQYAQLAAHVVSTRLVIPPSHMVSPPYPLLVALHGNNNSAEWSADYWRSPSELGWLVLLPQSSQPGWDSTTFVWNDEERAERDVERHYDEVHQEYAIDPKREVIGGFSMGGRIALSMALRGVIPARGVIAVAAAVRKDPAEQFPLDRINSDAKPRVYLIVGQGDEPFYEPTVALAEHLTAHDIACEVSVYPDLDHAYPLDFSDALNTALDFVMQK
jgi:dienelactone hydrolase